MAEVRSWRNCGPLPRCIVRGWPLALLWLGLLGTGAAGSNPAAGETLAGPVPATVIEVIDGDTLSVRARIWLSQEVLTRVRLAGIDAPELRGACARERALAVRARNFLVGKLALVEGRRVEVRLLDIRYGKYARRVLARVETMAGEDLGRALLATGLARAYAGGARPSWCDRVDGN